MKNERHSFGTIARRTAFPFCLFALVLVVLLSLSWFLLVPQLTRVEIGGTVRGLQELQSYKSDLEAQILQLEERRGTYLSPVQHTLYERIRSIRNHRMQFQEFRSQMRSINFNLVPGQFDVVAISGFYFDAASNTVEMRGEIRNVGPRSMTVLAQFVEEIDRMLMVTHIETSRYRRLEDEDGAFYSPFTLRVTLR